MTSRKKQSKGKGPQDGKRCSAPSSKRDKKLLARHTRELDAISPIADAVEQNNKALDAMDGYDFIVARQERLDAMDDYAFLVTRQVDLDAAYDNYNWNR